MKNYKLVNKQIIECSRDEGALFLESPERIVAKDKFFNVEISTVFLVFDHGFNFDNENKPVLFETMVFGGDFDNAQIRYCTYEEALEGHRKLCTLIRRHLFTNPTQEQIDEILGEFYKT